MALQTERSGFSHAAIVKAHGPPGAGVHTFPRPCQPRDMAKPKASVNANLWNFVPHD